MPSSSLPSPSSHPSLSIALAAPLRPGATSGNSVTTERWSEQLTTLGHRVEIIPVDENQMGTGSLAPEADLVIVLHARRCAAAARAAKAEKPDRPMVVALTGTDLYSDLPDHPDARESLDLADALVVLQEDGLDHLESMKPEWRGKAHVVHQSVARSGLTHRPDPDQFAVVVLSYLRDVKDPLLAAKAARLLPSSSAVHVVLGGSAHTDGWQTLAEQEQADNPRFTWLGGLDSDAVAELLARAHVLACTSLLEGGANVVSEAIAQGVAVIGTNIGGNRGLLGVDHPGLVPVGDAQALATLIDSLERNPDQLSALTQRSKDRQWMTAPSHESDQWQALLSTLLRHFV